MAAPSRRDRSTLSEGLVWRDLEKDLEQALSQIAELQAQIDAQGRMVSELKTKFDYFEEIKRIETEQQQRAVARRDKYIIFIFGVVATFMAGVFWKVWEANSTIERRLERVTLQTDKVDEAAETAADAKGQVNTLTGVITTKIESVDDGVNDIKRGQEQHGREIKKLNNDVTSLKYEIRRGR